MEIYPILPILYSCSQFSASLLKFSLINKGFSFSDLKKKNLEQILKSDLTNGIEKF